MKYNKINIEKDLIKVNSIVIQLKIDKRQF